jgi:hypothetical protein
MAVHLAAAVAALYGIVHLVEGWGLWRAKAWASWLGCITAALYLPFDIYALRHPSALAGRRGGGDQPAGGLGAGARPAQAHALS